MSEFIKIRNGTGKGDLVLRAKFVLKATDADDGTATITYGDNFPDAWQIKTASTAAEVLAAIEGAQEPGQTLVIMSREEYEKKYGAMTAETPVMTMGVDKGREGGDRGKRFVIRGSGNDWRVYNTMPPEGDDGCDGIFVTRERAEEYAASREREAGDVPMSTYEILKSQKDEISKRKLQEVYQEVYAVSFDGTGKLSPNSLALLSLGNQLATELENQSGFKWDVLIHGATDTDARFRCQPQGGEWWCSTAIFSREGLDDESGHGLAKRVYDMATDVLASWRTLGA